MSKLKDFLMERETLAAYNPLLVQYLHDLHAELSGNRPTYSQPSDYVQVRRPLSKAAIAP